MKTKIYIQNSKFTAGMTIKDSAEAEKNNMALHVCKNPETIVANREKLAASLNSSLADFVCAKQTHSAHFHEATLEDRGRGASRAEDAIADTDALYTYESELLLCSFAADCVPVIFYNEKTGLIGVIHSGWQGTVKEISLKLFEHLHQEEHCNPQDLHVQIGMALSQQKFEVDEDVFMKFQQLGYANDFVYFNEDTHKYHIDNQLTVKTQCELAGIPAEQITVDRTCTFLDPSGFSHRQDKGSGRHLIFIKRRN